jgi:hypothetical protein
LPLLTFTNTQKGVSFLRQLIFPLEPRSGFKNISACDEMIKHLLQGKPQPRLLLEPWKQNSLPAAMISVRRVSYPGEPFPGRPLFPRVALSEPACDQALELGGPIGKSVHQVFHKGFAKVLPEPVWIRLQPAVEKNTPAHALRTVFIV